MAGVAPYPDRSIYIELARRVAIDGGKALTARHEPRAVIYDGSLNEANRAVAEKGAYTCGCGDTRQMMIAYGSEPDDEGTQKETRYVACVNCDSIHLQPRWTQGRFAEGG